MKQILIFSFLLGTMPLLSQQLTGLQLLDKSIKYHDPKGNWESLSTQWTFTESRPDGSDSQTLIVIDNANSVFKIKSKRDGLDIAQKVEKDNCTYGVNGMQPDTAQVRKYRLNCERTQRIRNYYTYLWGLPMKLKDPGTIIHDEVKETTFEGKKCYALKVTYKKVWEMIFGIFIWISLIIK